MIASLKPYLLAGENVTGLVMPDTPGLSASENVRVEADALRSNLPERTHSAYMGKRLLRHGAITNGYVMHTGAAINVYAEGTPDTLLASYADTTVDPVLATVAFEHGVFIVEKTSKKLLFFDVASSALTLITSNTLHVANFKQRFVFSHPGTFFDQLFAGTSLALEDLGETALPGATEISAKSSRTLCWGGIASDWLAAMLDLSTLLSVVTDTKEVTVGEPGSEETYDLFKCFAGQLYMTDGEKDLYYEDENGNIALFHAGAVGANLYLFAPTLSSYYGCNKDDETEVARFAIDDFLRSNDWGYTVLPGGYDITGVWAMADEILVSTEAALWVLRPLGTEPSFSVSKLANFGAAVLGGNQHTAVIVAMDGKVHLYADGKLETVRTDSSLSFVYVSADELDGAVFLCDGTTTRYRREGRWTTLLAKITDAHNGVLVGTYSTTLPSFTTNVLRLGDTRLKCVRSVRVQGSGALYAQLFFREQENAPWKSTTTVLLDASGTALFSVTCYEFKVRIYGIAGATFYDVLVDYDIDRKSNVMKTRRI